jgi:putative hydrolase of HD superfamily
MSKEQNVINYYVLSNNLKNIIRTGWTTWNVQRDRVESVAEHIYGTQMLALAMCSEYQYDIDIYKVICMLAIHELGESVIGDLTQFQISKEEKEIIEHEAIHDILGSLIDGEEIEKLFLEFDKHETKEAMFAYQCDKLECDLQSKLYDQEECVDLKNQDNNALMRNSKVKELLDSGMSWSTMWLKFGQQTYPYDDNFRAVSEYAVNNDLTNIQQKKLTNKINKSK